MKRTLSVLLLMALCNCLIAKKTNKDSLRKVLSSNLADTNKINACIILCNSFKDTSADSALFYCNKAVKYIQPSSDPKWKSKVNMAFSRLYNYTMGDFAMAERYADEALKYALQTRNMRLIGDCYLNRGSVHGAQGNYEKAVTNFLKGEKYFISINYDIGLANIYNNIGIVNYNQKDYKQALMYYKKALTIKKVRNEPHDLEAAYQNISGVFYDLGKFDSAIYYVDMGLEISKTLGDKIGLAMGYNGKAMILRQLNKFDESMKCEEESMRQAKEAGDKFTLANAYNGIALIYQHNKKFQKAIVNYKQSIEINEEIKAKKELLEAYYGIATTYRQMGNYKSAYDYYEKFTALKDSIMDENVRKNVQDVEAKYETAKKEREIALLNKNKTEDSLKLAIKNIQVKDKDLQIEKRQGQIKYLVVIAVILAGFGIWIFNALRNKQKANLIIQQQKKDVEHQKHLVDEKQKEIIDSINYAKRIQNALLGQKEFFEKYIPDHFIMFKPKDIVSGDFYWATNVVQNPGSEVIYIAVCDSTGHGVPGAFMSLLNIGFLSEAIKEKDIRDTNLVFDYVRQRLIENISQEGQKDGMDAILVCIDKRNHTFTYSAANNAPLYVTNNIVNHLPCDKMPVGKGEKENGFTSHQIKYQKGDILYLFTDGYPDQFGGPKGKKFKYKQLEELLLSNIQESMAIQKQKLEYTFESWRGELEQVDDVCIVGIKL